MGSQEYLSESKVVISAKLFELDFIKLFTSVADVGWIVVDAGSVTLQINGVANQSITLYINDTFEFKKEQEWRIKTLVVKTTTTATIRYFFKRKAVVTL